MAHLNVSDVTLSFGGLKALSNVDMKIEPGQIKIFKPKRKNSGF